MKKVGLALVSFLAFQSVAQADVIACSFTEPFITVQLDLTTGDLVRNVIGDKVTSTKAMVGTKGDNIVLVESFDGEVNLEIHLDKKGSDGMSDRIYDYEGILNDKTFGKVYGGCNSK